MRYIRQLHQINNQVTGFLICLDMEYMKSKCSFVTTAWICDVAVSRKLWNTNFWKTSELRGLRQFHSIHYTVYPNKYAHGFCFAVRCCGYTLTDFPISIRLTSLALWQSNDCPSASKATLMNMDKYFMWIDYERLHNHNKAKHNKTVCIFLGIYYTNGVSALGPLKHRNQLVTMGLTWIAFASKLFCRGDSDFETDCLCGVWVRDLTTSPLYVGPLLRKSVLNTVACKFDRRANIFFSSPSKYIYIDNTCWYMLLHMYLDFFYFYFNF